jgi:predicted pyridoxine 5'-phosphate oxidase superfamily flavin-nucleotide-binding protein
MNGPFHEGELEVQSLAGESQMAERNGVVIANRIIGGARPFLQQQSMAVFGSRDREDNLWCSIVFGNPGFMRSEDGYAVDFDLSQVAVQGKDPLWANIEVNSAAGMLAIDLATRRRIRINGLLSRPRENSLRLSVQEAYPNCPKYITRRQLKTISPELTESLPDTTGATLGPDQQGRLTRADVLFVATAHPTLGADASHRGGAPGFIEVLDERTLRIPDYSGNSMFNTLGNLRVNARAGIIVPDFERGRTLQLSGTAETLWNQDDPADRTGGTHRFLAFRITHWLELASPAGVETEFLDYSPYNPTKTSRTGENR